MNKKNIAIVMGPIYLGGAERALINMLNHFDYDRYRIVLWICGEEKGNIHLIPPAVQVQYVPSEFALPQDPHSSSSLLHSMKATCARFMAKLNISKDEKNKHYYSRSLPLLCAETYDCIIAYRGWDASILRFAFHRLSGKKRIIWMHNDTYDTAYPFPLYYKKADHIFCVSKTIRLHMLEKYSLSPAKLSVFYNILNEKDVLAKGNLPCDTPMKHPALLSVGRLSWEKGFEIIPETASLLKKQGHKFCWYIVGEGYKRRDIEPKIKEFDVEDCVVLLGAKDNPYPYFRNCDIFVQTSITEGYCITTAEAKLFYKPVVTTNLPVMHEQFRHRENGLIAREITPFSLHEAISELLTNSSLRSQLQESLKKETCNHSEQFDSLYTYLDNP